MIVAICDYDAIKESYRFYPNLEVMKLSAYYKNKNHLTYGLFSLKKDEILLSTASKIILRKDRGNSDIPTEFLDLPRIEYGGMGFTNRHYIALPEEIEHTAPDRYFYDRYLSEAKMNKKTRTIAKRVLRLPMIRLSIDGKTCNNNWDTIDLGYSKQSVTIFDPNLTDLKDSFDILKSFERLLRLRWPLNIHSIEEGLYWSQLPITAESVFNYHGYDYNNLRELTALYNFKQKTYLIVFDHNSDYGTFKKELKQLMKLGIHQKIAGKAKVKIWYQPDNFTKPYERQITHLVDYFNSSFTETSFMENLQQRGMRSIPIWEGLAREDVELKFLINISPPLWRKQGEQLRL